MYLPEFTPDMAVESLIPYDQIVQDALRSVVARVLSQVTHGSLPGAHHFYVAFRTTSPGVMIPAHLRERYPEEMTIVIQHRFWDLTVLDDRFEIGLSFNQRPEKLVIPYAAIISFQDPSVNFELQFQAMMDDDEGPEAPPEPPEPPKPEPKGADDGSNVVTLDRFRKKS
jgi:uncharacterized protein